MPSSPTTLQLVDIPLRNVDKGPIDQHLNFDCTIVDPDPSASVPSSTGYVNKP